MMVIEVGLFAIGVLLGGVLTYALRLCAGRSQRRVHKRTPDAPPPAVANNTKAVSSSINFDQAHILLRSSVDGIALLHKGVFCDCNPAAEAFLGASRTQILGCLPLNFSPEFQPDGRPSSMVAQEYMRAAENGLPQRFIWQLQALNGKSFIAEVSLNLVVAEGYERVLAASIRDVTQQQLLKEQLTSQKKQLELILHSAAVGIWDWNINTGETIFNERWAHIVGYTLEELEPVSIQTWIELCHPDDLNESNMRLAEHWQGITSHYICEVRMRHRRGHWVWVLDVGQVVEKNADGSACRMVGTHLDISARKNADEQLQRVQSEIQQFFDLSLDFMCVLNINGALEKINNAFYLKLGFSEQELLTQSFFRIMHPDDVDDTVAQLTLLSEGKTVSNFKNRLQKKGGGYITLNWSFVPAPTVGKVYAVAYDVTEQEIVERELNTLSRIARETPNGIVISDAQGRIEWINEGMHHSSGYRIDEIKGKSAIDFLQGSHTDTRTLSYMRKCLELAKGFVVELLNYAKDGREYWVNINCNALLNENGSLQGFMAIQTDITVIKKANADFSKQQKMLEDMSQMAAIGAWEYDLKSQLLYWSAMTRTIHDVDANYQPSMDKTLLFYSEGKGRAMMRSVIAQAIEKGEPWQIEAQIQTAKGKEIWVRSTGKAEFEHGQCMRLMGSVQNIDEVKRHQLIYQYALQHSQALASLTVHPDIVAGDFNAAAPVIVKKCAMALNASRASIWLFDNALNSLQCSILYDEDSQGFESGQVLTRSDLPNYFSHIFQVSIINAYSANTHPATYEFSESYFKPNKIYSLLDAVVSGAGSFVGILCIEQKHRERLWTATEEAFVAALATLVSSVYDRQQKLRTQQELISAVEAANAAAQAKTDFLASMSHEIRTPMNGVMGMLGLVLKTPLSSDQERKIRIAQNSAQSLLAIINDILDFSKIDAGKLMLEETSFNLQTLFAEIAETMAFRAEEQQLKLIVDTHKLTEPNVIGDPGRLRQILVNLIGNALKFTHEGNVQVEVELQNVDALKKRLVCRVSDTGIGIAQDKQQDLFDAFTQVDVSNTRQYGGTGLGLSIVKKLCIAMGGDVSVKSVFGQGSCFTFDLLLAPNGLPPLTLPSIDLRGKQVLVVDDNTTNRQILTEQLTQWGLFADCAENAQQALNLCLARINNHLPCYDIALLDMLMPGMDGAALGKTFKADARLQMMPLIMMTSHAQRGEAAGLAELGFSGYFPKPVSPKTLFEAIAVVLDGELLRYATPLVTEHFLKHLIPNKNEPLQAYSWPAGARILLVEDNRINQQVALDLLDDMGLPVDVANDGQEALTMLNQTANGDAYSLVLMDCQMPVLDGFAATRAIRDGAAGEANRHITIIAMTANAMAGDKKRCLDAGMNDYLSKPVDPDVLENMLVQWLCASASSSTPKLITSDVITSNVKTPVLTPSALVAPVNATKKPFVSQPSAQESAAQTSALLWDQSRLLKRMHGRHERVKVLVARYSEQSSELITDLYDSVELQAFEQALKLADALKDIATHLEAHPLAVLLDELQVHCRAQAAEAALQAAGEILSHNESLQQLLAEYLLATEG